MESLNLRIQNWKGREVEEISYSLSLKVPPKEELLRLIPSHLSSLQHSWKFHTGILSQADHKLNVCLYREYHEPKVGVFVRVFGDRKSYDEIVEVRGVDVTYVADPQGITVEDNMSKVTNIPKLSSEGEEEDSGGSCDFWQSTCGWPEETSVVFLLFHVVKRKAPRIIDEDSDHLLPPGTLSMSGLLSTKPYFLSKECSDVTIKCGSSSFPAHRLILSNKSAYFGSMFGSAMKESREGVVEVSDVDPPVMKEVLRFIYSGEIEGGTSLVKELFVAADKYGMDDLRGLCEKQMLESLCVDSAMETYDLSRTHTSPLLLKRAKEIIVWNKERFIPDSEAFREFTCKYPELMFDLFQMKFHPT